MMNPSRIRDEEQRSSRNRGPGVAGRLSSRDTAERVRAVRGSGVEMAGMAERYWKELRPSSAAKLRLDVSIRPDQGPAERGLRRPRPQIRPKLRTTSR